MVIKKVISFYGLWMISSMDGAVLEARGRTSENLGTLEVSFTVEWPG